jgi:hypothetical protein
MVDFLIAIAIVVGVPAMLLGLLQLIAPQSSLPERVRHRFTQYKLWQLMVAVVLLGLLFSMITVRAPILPFSLAVLIVLVLFVKAWRDEFVFLMGLRDEDFPGRNDKLVWVLVLLLFAPVGTWFFRAYRLAHWPEPEPQPRPETTPGSAIPKPV